MSRNGRRQEIGFGSDSFLDIVANIVGILIILIVIAGVRVGRQPVPPETVTARTLDPLCTSGERGHAEAVPQAPDAARPEPACAETTDRNRAQRAPWKEPSPVRLSGPPPLAGLPNPIASRSQGLSNRVPEANTTMRRDAADRDRAQREQLRERRETEWEQYRAAANRLAWQDGVLRRLLDELRRLQRELARLSEQRDRQQRLLAALQRQLQTKTAAADKLQEQLAAATERLETLQREQAAVDDRVQRVRLALQRSRRERDTMAAELAALQKAAGPVKELKHRVNPVGRQVSGPELHVRLLHGKVAVVPLEELAERLKEDLRKRRNWLLEYGAYEGTVGPLQGFAMRYLVERQTPSVLDEIRYGRGYVQFGVTYWELVPQPDLPEQMLEEALGLRGELRQRLAAAPAGTTVTVWVYPDSFGEYQLLDAALHRMGFEVAARPLPFGIPVAGSPHGTKSIGQ